MQTITIGIAGGSGSGKSWFARKLQSVFPAQTTLVEQDWYYRDLSGLPFAEAEATNFDHPDAIEFSLLESHLEALKRGQTVYAPNYRFSDYRREEAVHRLDPAPLLILEGLFVLQQQGIRDRLDRKLYIQAQPELRLSRRLKRDVEERGYSEGQIRQSWQELAEPMFRQWVAPSAAHADFVWEPSADQAFENSFIAELQRRLS